MFARSFVLFLFAFVANYNKQQQQSLKKSIKQNKTTNEENSISGYVEVKAKSQLRNNWLSLSTRLTTWNASHMRTYKHKSAIHILYVLKANNENE